MPRQKEVTKSPFVFELFLLIYGFTLIAYVEGGY